MNIAVRIVLNFFRVMGNHQNSLAMMMGAVVHEFVKLILLPASIPVVGSSRINTSGSRSKHTRNHRSLLCPPDRDPKRLSRCSHIPTESRLAFDMLLIMSIQATEPTLSRIATRFDKFINRTWKTSIKLAIC